MRIGFPGKATALLYWDRSSCGARAVNAIMAGESRVAGALKLQHRAMSRVVSRVSSKHGDGDARRHANALCSDSCIASGICKSRRTQAIAQTRQLTGDVIAGTKRRSTKDMTASCSSRASSVAIDDTRPSLWSQSKLSRQPTRAHAFATYARWRSAKHCSTLSLASRPLLLVVSASSGPPPSHAYVPAHTGSRAIGTISTDLRDPSCNVFLSTGGSRIQSNDVIVQINCR